MTVDTDQLREFVSTSVSDESLQLLLDAAYQTIDACIGPAGDRQEFFTAAGDLLMLSRAAESITGVTENVGRSSVVLAADDYELRPSGSTLVRLWTGTNPGWSWCGRVDVAYSPFDDTATRDRVAIELVKLDVAFNPGLAGQTIGTWSESYTASGQGGYADQREAILASLNPVPGVF
jgi:hypothetical protein